MRLLMTLLVRDEEDILAENIRFHLKMGVDYIIATDNGSSDGTIAILEEFQRQGVLSLIHEPSDDYAQWKWVSRMAQLAFRDEAADWVINNDADEFWWPKAASLKEVLAEVLAEYSIVECSRYNFKAREFAPSIPWHQSMNIRELVSRNTRGKPLPPKICHRGMPDIVLSQGNHGVTSPAGLRSQATSEIDILHFPMRSYRQFENKIALGGAAYERNTELPPQAGATWRALYAKYQAGELEAFYEAELLTPEQARSGLDSGELCTDERLKDFFKDFFSEDRVLAESSELSRVTER